MGCALALEADEYVFTMHFYDSPIAMLYGKTTYHEEQIELSIDGERVGAGCEPGRIGIAELRRGTRDRRW